MSDVRRQELGDVCYWRWMMNNLGRGNWFLMFGLFVVGVAVFVGAVSWNGAQGTTYNVTEDAPYFHNLTLNVTDYLDSMTFRIDDSQNVVWNGVSINYSQVSEWFILDESTGNLTISAVHNNQTGNFSIHIVVYNGTSSQGEDFMFNISSFNDAPNFTALEDSYTFDESVIPHTFDINATDEEGEYDGTGYPLNWSVNVTSCDYVDSSKTDNESCNDLLLNNFSVGNTTYRLNITATDEFIGNYILLLKVNDSNSETERNVTFVVANINDAPNITFACDDNRNMTEDDIMSCWVNATDVDEDSNLTFTIYSNLAQFTFNDSTTSYVYAGCSEGVQCNASANVTFILNDSAVGNWSVNISVTDTGSVNTIDWANFSFFVNNTEDNVSIESISDFIAYGDTTFTIRGYDNDFLVDSSQSSTKNERLTFISNNTNLVYFLEPSPFKTNEVNYSVATAYVNHTYAIENNITNASIRINVTDRLGNSLTEYYSSDETIFMINFSSENAPEWNDSLDDPVSLNLTEDIAFSYNVSMNVSDEEGDSITFYYTNISAEFCSLNSTNFNSTSGIINFTPTDCDVGYHNVTIIASDSKLNSTAKQFNFTVNNIADSPEIENLYLFSNETPIANGSTRSIVAGVSDKVTLRVDDNDFLIPSGQRSAFYNESLSIDVIATNSSGGEVDLFEFSFGGVYGGVGGDGSIMVYNVSYTPSISQVENYTVFINITDNSSVSINTTFYLNIIESANDPVLAEISNKSVTIYDVLNFTVSATDDEDDFAGLNLSYSIINLTVDAPNLTIGNESGVVSFNMNSNSTYAGIWNYTVTVTDSNTQTNSTTFWLFVYGNVTLVSPSENIVFNISENVASLLNFTTNHSVGDNLTYEFWIDTITCAYQNSSNCTYGNLSRREVGNYFGNGTANNWSFTSDYTDETYGNLKNLTISVYPNTTNLNSIQRAFVATNFTFKLNVNHTNAPIRLIEASGFPNPWPDGTVGTAVTISLNDYFVDEDFLDSYYLQSINANVTSNLGGSSLIYAEESSSNYLPWNGTITDWSLQINSALTTSEVLTINLSESESSAYDSFSIDFNPPSITTVTTPSSGGGSTTKLKHFSLKLIAPQDIIISELGFIDIPFSIQNNGQIDLRGISLSSFVRFNNAFSDDVRISLGDNYIEELKFGQSENFTMRISANTQRAGKYKATIMANVTSPKFSDFGDFFIEIKKANESEAEQILLFTEKFVAGNPECLELTELLNLAEESFLLGEYSNSIRLAREVTDACEDAIEANEQIRYKVEGFVQDNFYYISFATLVIFFAGFVFYIYKRVRFNKSGMDEYV